MSEILGITGHRPHKLGNDYDLVSPVVRGIEAALQLKIAHYRPERIVCGMAQGIDTVMALLALDNKIPLTCVLPQKGQDRPWPDSARVLYDSILEQADQIVICDLGLIATYDEYKDLEATEYQNKWMNVRNIWIVDHITRLIGVWDGSKGGTKNCLDYAYRKGRPVDRITFKL